MTPTNEPLILRDPEAFRQHADALRAAGKRVGVVPTMGALHAGHLELARAVRERADAVVVTIFVNPTQFAPGEDLDAYPRTFDADVAACREAGVDAVFAPQARAMYPPGDETRVRVGPTAQGLCAVDRPTHFEGVATVVTKLLVLAGPCAAAFGRKDYQQLCVIRRLVADLLLPVEVVGVPIVREPDGLAMSSRNLYLNPEERVRARALSRALAAAARAFEAGERSAAALRGPVVEALTEASDGVDYATLADADTLAPFDDTATLPDRALFAVAARFRATRLLDNVVLGEDPPPPGAA